MLPPLANLSLSIGAKRKFGGEGSSESTESTESTEGTEAEQLLKILTELPPLETMSLSRLEDLQPDWVYALSNAQFDMLLSLRLYTGPFYRFMAPVLDPVHVREVQSSRDPTSAVMHEFSKSDDDPSVVLFVALANARRRMRPQEPSPLFLKEGRDPKYIDDMPEPKFREMVADLLTRYGAKRGNDAEEPSEMLERFEGLLRHHEADIVDALLRELWAAVRHAALALQKLILGSGVVVGTGAVRMYRGTRTDSTREQLQNSFVSVSRNEGVARAFTTNPELSYTDPKMGATGQCCMMRVSLLEMTPYLDVDATLRNSHGWGYYLGEAELILPPGLSWKESFEHHEQPVEFPEEIRKSHYYSGVDLLRELYYSVAYWMAGPPVYGQCSVGPPPTISVHRRAPR